MTRSAQSVVSEPTTNSFFTVGGGSTFFLSRILYHVMEGLILLMDVIAPEKAIAGNGILLIGVNLLDKIYGTHISFYPRYPVSSIGDLRPYTPIGMVPGMVGLFNLDHDISESTNLVDARGDILKQ